MKILVTGGAGFIGSNFVHYLLENHSHWDITNFDKLTYAGNLANLKSIEHSPRYHFIMGDISDPSTVDSVLSHGYDAVVNFAAESHVDRSILNSAPFILANVLGVQVLLNAAKKYNIRRFLQISTDEVYGSIDQGKFRETSPLSPSSPYSASKTAADLLCLAYFKTFKTPVVITRCTNNFGPYQFPEKLIPLVITNAIENKSVPVYGDGLNRRDWIYVLDHCSAIDSVLQKGVSGSIYNVGAGNDITNLEIVKAILELLNKPESLIEFVSDRPGHDRRYALSISKIKRELNWKPAYKFKKALADTVNWYLKNDDWWRTIKSGEYSSYYEKVYLRR
jgi:dTDP-glucose 4,6-dehydratase